MEKLLGNKVSVYFKNDSDFITGLLFDITSEYIYLQDYKNIIYTIPKINIKYYTSESVQTSFNDKDAIEQKNNERFLRVMIDGEYITNISVPKQINLLSCSDAILELVWGSQVVQDKLHNKVQKSIEYDVGQINIITSVQPHYDHKPDSSFSMEIGQRLNNPIEMASKIHGRK